MTAPPSSLTLTLTVYAIPVARPAALIVILIDGEPLPLAAVTSPTAVHRPSNSRPSRLHPSVFSSAPIPPASMPLVGVPPHPLPGSLRDFTALTSRNSP